MSRLGLRQIRKPNVSGAAFVVEPSFDHIPAPTDNQVTNGLQTDNKEVTDQVTNGLQTDNKEVTTCEVTHAHAPLTNSKRVTERVTSSRVNGIQTDNKEVTNPTWDTLRGHEARLLQFIFDECRATGDLLSPPITLDRIAICLGSRKGTAKTITIRLVKKGLVTRESSATGRGGFTRFRIEKSLYQALLIRETDNKRVTNREQTGNKEVTERVTERVTSVPSSSSVLIKEEFKTTTTGEPDLCKVDPTKLPPEWEHVNCVPLADYGFGEAQLSQIVRDKLLTPEMVQDSIYAFAFDLRENTKAKELRGAPLNYFMGTLRKGFAYARPPNYETPQEAARRKRLELLQREESQRQAEEQQILELEFSIWKRGQSVTEIVAQLPEHARRPGPVQDSALKNYFEEYVWPERQTISLGLSTLDRAEICKQIDGAIGESERSG
ncbi:hypothetical protein WDW86_14230 [Bdellovibrionota bacterium FG-2]